MKFIALATCLIWPIGAILAASSPKSANKYETYRARAKSGPIELNDASYQELTAIPRDYHLVVLLTATEARFGCELCRAFQPEWDFLGRSWHKADLGDSTKTLIGTLDFSRGRKTFHSLMLQSAPIVLLFPPTSGPGSKPDNKPIRFDFTGPISAEQMNTWISRLLPDGPRPSLNRPINYGKIAILATMLLGLISLLTVTSAYVLPIIQSRNLWTAVSLLLILLFTSGYMFNHIRKVPYVTGDGKGGISYFAAGFSNQLGLESQVVAAICNQAHIPRWISHFANSVKSLDGVLSLATIALVMKSPRTPDPKLQRTGVFIWCGILWMVYSLLISIFRGKSTGYPLSLPPF
ncbi:oligosaccharyl transferase subunit ost3/OST6 [Myotisia sp. PD_48]|nr:oligosaccharyl transferase subunit ost3/OST6 [Myotisia sp. PD_48]